MSTTTNNTQAANSTQAGKTAGQPRVGGRFAKKPAPLSQTAKTATHSDAAFASLCVLPSCIADVSELAGNPKAMGLATRLAMSEKDLRAATSEVGALRARAQAGDSRVVELAAEKSVIEGQLRSAQGNSKTLEDKLNIAQVQLRNANEEKATVADLLERTSIASDLNAQAAEWSDWVLKAATKAAGIDDPERLAHKIEALQASDRNNGELRQELHGLRMRVENLAEDKRALITAHDILGAEVDRLIADSPRLPLWARALASLVALLAVAIVSHRMGFEAHAALIGGGK